MRIVELEIRPARAGDLPSMVAIRHDAGLVAWPHILPPAAFESLPFPQRWIEAIDDSDPRVTFLVAERDVRAIGFALTRPSGDADATETTGELDGFYVAPDCWGLGVGRALLASAVATLRAARFRDATLWTAAENHRPRRIYETAGWRLDGADRKRTLGGVDFVEVRYRLSLGSSS
jgi:GNAT superfamily N-acetyltransferase